MKVIFKILLIAICSVSYSQCIELTEVPSYPIAASGSSFLKTAGVTTFVQRSEGVFEITIIADSLSGADLATGAEIPVLIKDDDGTILADFDWIAGSAVSASANDVGGKWASDFVPYLETDPILTPATLQTGVAFEFRKAEWAEAADYVYSSGSVVSGRWESGATRLNFEVATIPIYMNRLVDVFSGMIGWTATTLTFHAGPRNYPLTAQYLPDSTRWIKNGVLTALGSLTQETRYIRQSTSGGHSGGGVDSFYIERTYGGITGFHYSHDHRYLRQADTPEEYQPHEEGGATNGYRYTMVFNESSGDGASGIRTLNTGFTTTAFSSVASGTFTHAATTPDLVFGTLYVFSYETASPDGQDINYNYEYELNYAF